DTGPTVGPAERMDTQNAMLSTDALYKIAPDSGFSSRVSEVDGGERNGGAGNLLLGEHNVLTKRLARISECQNDEGCRCDSGSVVKVIIKILGVLLMLYIFICALDLLSNAFRLLGGKTAGSVFRESSLLANPITGLMIGVLATVILQSSSTSSSIVITMVASNILDLQPAIPIIMGANIGTTVTNTLVSLAHSTNRREFRRAFSGAVVHDVFNWLTVLILLPLEVVTGYLYHLTKAIVSTLNLEDMKAKDQDLLMVITKPLTSRIVQIDQDVIPAIAEGKLEYADKPLLKIFCTFNSTEESLITNETILNDTTKMESWTLVNKTVVKMVPLEKCESLFSLIGWSDTPSGILLFVFSIISLSLCLYTMVKLLHSLLGGQIAKVARKTINSDFPRPFQWLTGYVAILIGAGMTILVQSSSVFTSALTPLVGIGCLKLERMYPLTLGSNIGTTFTGILAALASSSATISVALQLAFCHLFFNITGILLFYPVPTMRSIVLDTAKYLGRTTARYRWFAIAYIIFMFIIFPGFFFIVSLAGRIVFILTICIITSFASFVVVLNIMQRNPGFLPVRFRTWNFMPEILRSLAPIDRFLNRVMVPFRKCCCKCCVKHCQCTEQVSDTDLGFVDSDSDVETSLQTSYPPSAASSRTVLSSQSGPDLKSSSSRIYKPRDTVSVKNSLMKSPSVVEESIPEAPEASSATALLDESGDRDHIIKFYISKTDLHKVIDKSDGEIAPVKVSVFHERLNESAMVLK
ncbi:unnamed protein product, partial [Candidula unifasciata]